MSTITELKPTYSDVASFYSKATVRSRTDANGVTLQELFSYGIHVATYRNGEAEILEWASTTTGRHIKEFLLQCGLKAQSKKQMLADYPRKDGNA